MSKPTSKANSRNRKSRNRKSRNRKSKSYSVTIKNKDDFNQQLDWFLDDESIFSNMNRHGNTKWQPADLARQALVFSWSEKDCVTDGFDESVKRCNKLKIPTAIGTYQGFMGALATTRQRIIPRLCSLLQQKSGEIASNYQRFTASP